MATITMPVIDDSIFAASDNFKKRGNWTEERHEVLKNLTGAEIDAEAERLEAENPGKYLTPEELDERLALIQEEWTAQRRAELVGA